MVLRMAGIRSVLAVLLLAGAGGCYSYAPVESPAPGTEIRIQVPVQSAVVRPNQAPESMSFEGTLVALSDTLSLEVTSRREVGAFREIVEQDTLRVAHANILLLEERTFSKPKTYAFTAVLTAGAVALGVAAMNTLTGQAGDSDRPGDGGNPNSQQVVLSGIFSKLFRLIGG